MRAVPAAVIENVDVQAATISTDRPESDGTLGVGFHHHRDRARHRRRAHGPGVHLWQQRLSRARVRQARRGHSRTLGAEVPALWEAMRVAIRNEGHVGNAAMALAAVDTALWDLAARLLDVPLCTLLGQVRGRVAVYGSGGFCSYDQIRSPDSWAGGPVRGCAGLR